MTIPREVARIAHEISVTASPSDRATLRSYLLQIETDEELFGRRIKKCVRALDRFTMNDVAELKKWLPVILKYV